MGNTKLETLGQTLTELVDDLGTDSDLIECLVDVYTQRITTKSDYARLHASVIAKAASCGLITTYHPHGGFGGAWRISSIGLLFLEEVT